MANVRRFAFSLPRCIFANCAVPATSVMFGITFGEGQQNQLVAATEEERDKWVSAVLAAVPRPMLKTQSKNKKLNRKPSGKDKE